MPIQEGEILFCNFLSLVSDSNFNRTEEYLIIYMNINYIITPHKQICSDNLIYVIFPILKHGLDFSYKECYKAVSLPKCH